MKLRFRTVTGKIFNIELLPEETFADVRQHLEEKECFDCTNCCFIYGSSFLEDNQKIGSLIMSPNSYIIVHSNVNPKIISHQKDYDNQHAEIATNSDIKYNVNASNNITLQYNDPPDFDQLVSTLKELEFTEELAKRALRNSNYSFDDALDMLVNGKISDDQSPSEVEASTQNINQGNTLLESSQSTEKNITPTNYGDLQNQFDSLTQDEKTALSRLVKLGLDAETTLDIFLNCGKNEQEANNYISVVLQ